MTVCKAAGGAVCDRRAINFRSNIEGRQVRTSAPARSPTRPRACPPRPGPLPGRAGAARHISAAGPHRLRHSETLCSFHSQWTGARRSGRPRGRRACWDTSPPAPPPITERPSPSRGESARAFHGASLSIKLRIDVAQSRSATPGIDRTADVAACRWRRRGAKSLHLFRATARWP